jgi:hypothetical protein
MPFIEMAEFTVTVNGVVIVVLPAQKHAATFPGHVVSEPDNVFVVLHCELVVFQVPVKLAAVGVVVP